MRIALVTTSYPRDRDDPSGHFVRAEVRALIEAGHEVLVFAPSSEQRDADDAARLVELPHLGLFGWPGALTRLSRRPWRSIGLLPFVLRARHWLRSLGPFDRVVAHWLVPCFWPISRDHAGETCVVCHGSDVRLVERLPRALQRSLLSSLARPGVNVRCVSGELARRLIRLCHGHRLEPFPIVVEPAALELPALRTRAELRRELGLSDTPTLVIVGRVVASKRIDVALAVIAAASRSVAPELRPSVIVIGDGPELARLTRLHPEAQWLGPLGRLQTLEYLRAADVLVSASLDEGAPCAVREARALGTRVIAAAAGDLSEWAKLDSGLHVHTAFDAPPHPDAELAVASIRTALEAARR